MGGWVGVWGGEYVYIEWGCIGLADNIHSSIHHTP